MAETSQPARPVLPGEDQKVVTLREFEQRLSDLKSSISTMFASERELRETITNKVEASLDAQKHALHVSLDAFKDHTAAQFAANDKAITKAEEAQREYNIRSNEFRAQLDDQAKLLMTRSETFSLLKGIEERISRLSESGDQRWHALTEDIKGLRVQMVTHVERSWYEREHGILEDRVRLLEQANSNLQGRLWAVGAAVSFVVVVVNVLMRFIGTR